MTALRLAIAGAAAITAGFPGAPQPHGPRTEMREKLLTISSLTIELLLAPVRMTSAVQRHKPMRTYGHQPTGFYNGWGEMKEAGWLEIKLVADCGRWMECRFLWTLVATDMATG